MPIALSRWVPLIVTAVGGSGGNITALRAMRVLKVLRSINVSVGLRLLIKAMLDAIPMMSNVLLLLAFIIFMYAAMGVQLYSGQLRYVSARVRVHAGV